MFRWHEARLAAVAGYCAVGTQTRINGWVTRSYPPEARTTGIGIGWSLGIGRLGGIIGPSLTAIIVAATGGGAAAFLLFASVGVLGAVLSPSLREALASAADERRTTLWNMASPPEATSNPNCRYTASRPSSNTPSATR